MPRMEDRWRVTVRLTEEAHSGWVDASFRRGVTIAALMEAIGIFMARHPVEPQEPPLVDIRDEVVNQARLVDAERRKRR